MSDHTSLQHPISRDPRRLPRCCICNGPVLLETSKTDEYGQALHEECYVLKLCLKQEWYVLKLWLKADFLNDGGTYAGPRQTGTRSITFAKPRWQRSGSRPYQKARRACDILMQRARRVSWHRWPRNLELAAVATVLLLTCWIAYGDGHPASFLGSLGLQRSNAVKEQISLRPAKAMPAKGSSTLRTVSVSGEQADTASVLQQVGSAGSEVVHIGDDVTVRYFPTKTARTASGSGRKVSSRYIGKDVTVRYFTPIAGHTRN